jgi:aminomethyltransferase
MKNTPLINKHRQLGAKIVEFAGFNMPVEYSGISDEHLTVRNAVGIFDVSHMGEFWVSGPEAIELIQKVSSNDAKKLETGKAQYSCLPNGQGGIVDDLLVYRYDDQEYMLVVNAANIEKDWNWILKHNSMNAKMDNASDRMSLLALQGPDSLSTLEKLTDINPGELKPFRFTIGSVAGVDSVIISATGYTGETGFELYLDNHHAGKVWDALLDAGKEFGIKPAGLGARDTLRLEAGLCLYGNDIDDQTSPIEAGLGWIVKFEDYKDFVDKEFLWKQKQEGVNRMLIGFMLTEKGIPRQHYEIVNQDGDLIGEVTSGTHSPVLGQGIGMGYVKTKHSQMGNEIFIRIRNKSVKAEVVKIPFHK